ncbi:MAG: GMC oxidoreductase [Rhodothermales bacterium]
MAQHEFDADVVVIGSGFGGSVAALRFAETGERVLVLERGRWVSREHFEADPDAFWNPRRHRFGFNELRPRGRHIIPWIGSAVGGGSHVYAATLKRRDSFHDFPAAITKEDMDSFYTIAEDVMDAQRYPDHPPYSDVRATQLLYDIGARLQEKAPDLVEDWGPINLGISFAPPDGTPGAEFVNKHGATQRYSDPREQSLLGGDIDAKNSLDRNYLFLAQQHGAKIRALCQTDKIEPLEGGGFRIHYVKYVEETRAFRRLARNWLPSLIAPRDERHSCTARRLVVSAGSVGSSELLLRNRDVHRTLTNLSPRLGERYTSNGDYVSLMLPFRGFFVSWLGVAVVLFALILGPLWLAAIGGAAYVLGLVVSRPSFDPDIGTTNSDYIKFRHRDGSSQGTYVESGRYPTPLRLGLAILLSTFGLWRPRHYAAIVRLTRFLRRFVPPFALIARSWPIPLLKMGRDDAYGTFKLDKNGRAFIDYDFDANRAFYRYLNRLGRLVARTAHAWWVPNVPAQLLKRVEIPHNQGGVPMGETAEDGVVDHAGRVFSYTNLMVLDGSIIPVAPGPNPALTILALAERAMAHLRKQLETKGAIYPETAPLNQSERADDNLRRVDA